ncbi:MAG: zinc ABC transporter substrate-binding protein [Actinomycetota bacterium]|nr:zinc ABC transporter substrate-binding protein [Actinomycetota bacterium]
MVLILVSVALAAASCSSDGGDGDRLRVVASFYPLAYAAREVGGRGVDVENLSPPGIEPHDLEVSPRDVARIRAADVVLLMGGRFQAGVEDAAGTGERVLRLLETPGLDPLPNGDPHVWLDPVRFALVGRRIARALARPSRGRALARRLRRLDGEYRRGLADCSRRVVVTSHEAFAYLADRYGLREIPITGRNPEAEPSPHALERVVDLVRETGATTVYLEPLARRRVVETVARETGARVATLNPIEGLTREEDARGEDYFSLMRLHLAALRRGLGCR